jgi:asparagine synthetase B (glutamine-hydrolysing)
LPAGLLAWINRNTSPADCYHFTALLDCLSHRGRDGSWWVNLGSIALGQQNFHLSPNQPFLPLKHQDQNVHLAFDGRLDHPLELAKELDLPRPIAIPDAALILRAYFHWGPCYADHVRGSLAAIIVDLENRRVIASRDILGRYPL